MKWRYFRSQVNEWHSYRRWRTALFIFLQLEYEQKTQSKDSECKWLKWWRRYDGQTPQWLIAPSSSSIYHIVIIQMDARRKQEMVNFSDNEIRPSSIDASWHFCSSLATGAKRMPFDFSRNVICDLDWNSLNLMITSVHTLYSNLMISACVDWATQQKASKKC